MEIKARETESPKMLVAYVNSPSELSLPLSTPSQSIPPSNNEASLARPAEWNEESREIIEGKKTEPADISDLVRNTKESFLQDLRIARSRVL